MLRLGRALAIGLVALVLLSGCGGGGSASASTCPNPAVFDNTACKFDDAGSKFGP